MTRRQIAQVMTFKHSLKLGEGKSWTTPLLYQSTRSPSISRRRPIQPALQPKRVYEDARDPGFFRLVGRTLSWNSTASSTLPWCFIVNARFFILVNVSGCSSPSNHPTRLHHHMSTGRISRPWCVKPSGASAGSPASSSPFIRPDMFLTKPTHV